MRINLHVISHSIGCLTNLPNQKQRHSERMALNVMRMNEQQHRIIQQVMLLGDSGVGKTCLLVRFRDGTFLSGSFISTVGIDFRVSKNTNNFFLFFFLFYDHHYMDWRHIPFCLSSCKLSEINIKWMIKLSRCWQLFSQYTMKQPSSLVEQILQRVHNCSTS